MVLAQIFNFMFFPEIKREISIWNIVPLCLDCYVFLIKMMIDPMVPIYSNPGKDVHKHWNVVELMNVKFTRKISSLMIIFGFREDYLSF